MAPEARRLRLAGLGLLAAFLAWLPVEDVRAGWPLGLAAGGCAWGAWAVQVRRGWRGGRLAALGTAAGLAVAPLAVGLMLFKSGLHAHGFLDFGPGELLAMLAGAPLWMAAGALVGWLAARRR
jgi:hypothetical protein